MSHINRSRAVFRHCVADFLASWKSLVLTDVAFKAVAFILLTPLVGLMFRGFIAASGKAVLSDLDIAFFLLLLAGVLCGIVVSASLLGIASLEQAVLLLILRNRDEGRPLRTLAALQLAVGRAWLLLRLMARIVSLAIMASAPFLGALGAVYFALLTEYDINYYLKETPASFRTALAIGGVIGLGYLWLSIRLLTSWYFALPIALFEGVAPAKALQLSRRRADGCRVMIMLWTLAWLLVTTVLSAVTTALIFALGEWAIPATTNSLRLLSVAGGAIVLLWAVTGAAVNLVSATTFGVIYWNLYRQWGGGKEVARAPLPPTVDTVEVELRITKERVLAAAIIGGLAASAIGAVVLGSIAIEDRVKIMAHRGASTMAPENTMAAFREAIQLGADYIELDVQETADGEVVVFHDSDFMKLAEQPLKIWDATRNDLADIDIGSWFDPKFQDQRTPTLAEVLDLCKGKIKVNIELKYYGHNQDLERRVADIVDARQMDDEIVVMSLDVPGIQRMRDLKPNWRIGQVMSVAAGKLKGLGVDFVAVNAKFANRRLIREAHANDMQVYVWTVNDAPTISSMISLGVDGILTDEPKLAMSVLRQRREMSGPERLLMVFATYLDIKPSVGEQ